MQHLTDNQRFIINLLLWAVGAYVALLVIGWLIKVVAIFLIQTFGTGYLVFAAKFFPATVLVAAGWIGIDLMKERQLKRALNMQGVEV